MQIIKCKDEKQINIILNFFWTPSHKSNLPYIYLFVYRSLCLIELLCYAQGWDELNFPATAPSHKTGMKEPRPETPDNGVTRVCINFASHRINASLSERITFEKGNSFPLPCNLRQNYVVIKFCWDQFGQFWVKRLANIYIRTLNTKGIKEITFLEKCHHQKKI